MKYDDRIEIRDPRFKALVMPNVHMETLATGCRWAEGPAWFPAHRTLVWSDIPNDRVLRWDEASGAVATFLQPCGNHNGHTVDRQGRLVSCEHRGRRVSRIEHDGSVTTIADRWRGKRLNSPNDVAVKSDGSVWFTDPTYGIDGDYEGDRAESEIGASNVYRVDPDGTVEAVATDFVKPNGIAFSPDETRLFVADTGATHREDGPRHIRVFDVESGGRLSGGAVFATCDAGLFDGFRFDAASNLWTSAGDGVRTYAPDGALLGIIHVEETVANVEFGGAKRNRLFICATTTLRAIHVNARGATRP